MGYDMRFVTIPVGETEEVSKIRELAYALCKLRDALPDEERGRLTEAELRSGGFLDKIPANASPRYRAVQTAVRETFNFADFAERSYFRLNVWGMGRYRDLMISLGMVYESRSERTWPEWERYPDDAKRQSWFENAHEHLEYASELDPEVPADVLAAAQEYVDATATMRRFHPAGGDTIPLHKFGTNDGWVVTPDELKAALAVYDRADNRESVLATIATREGERAYWDRWIDYLRLAVDHDGFKVR